MRAQLIAENMDFKRGQSSKEALDIGIDAKIAELDSDKMLGALYHYWLWNGDEGLKGYEGLNGATLSKREEEIIRQVAPALKDQIYIGALHRSDEDAAKEIAEEILKYKYTYWVFEIWDDAYRIAYSNVRLPEATVLDPADFI